MGPGTSTACSMWRGTGRRCNPRPSGRLAARFHSACCGGKLDRTTGHSTVLRQSHVSAYHSHARCFTLILLQNLTFNHIWPLNQAVAGAMASTPPWREILVLLQNKAVSRDPRISATSLGHQQCSRIITSAGHSFFCTIVCACTSPQAQFTLPAEIRQDAPALTWTWHGAASAAECKGCAAKY
jgi:hypothetical protein